MRWRKSSWTSSSVTELKRLQKEYKVIRFEKLMLHKTTNQFFKNAPTERQKGLTFTEMVILPVRTAFVRLEMIITRAFPLCCPMEARELEHAEWNKIRKYHGQSEQERELLSNVWQWAEFVLIPPHFLTAPGGYTLSNPMASFARDVISQTKLENHPLHDWLPLEKRREDIVKNMCDIRALPSHLKQCSYEPWNTKKHAKRHRLFEVLRFGALLSRNDMMVDNKSG